MECLAGELVHRLSVQLADAGSVQQVWTYRPDAKDAILRKASSMPRLCSTAQHSQQLHAGDKARVPQNA